MTGENRYIHELNMDPIRHFWNFSNCKFDAAIGGWQVFRNEYEFSPGRERTHTLPSSRSFLWKSRQKNVGGDVNGTLGRVPCYRARTATSLQPL